MFLLTFANLCGHKSCWHKLSKCLPHTPITTKPACRLSSDLFEFRRCSSDSGSVVFSCVRSPIWNSYVDCKQSSKLKLPYTCNKSAPQLLGLSISHCECVACAAGYNSDIGHALSILSVSLGNQHAGFWQHKLRTLVAL